MKVMIGHIAVDVNGVATGGSSAALKSDTIFTRPYYNKNWKRIYRSNNLTKAEKIASIMEQICANDNIQYSPTEAKQLYDYAHECKWDVSKISQPCGANSLMMILVIARALGHVQGKPDKFEFANLGNFLSNASFQTVSFTSEADLRRGDILVSDSHIAIVLSDGDNVDRRSAAQTVLDKQAKNKAYLGDGIGTAVTRTSISVYSGPGTHFIEYKVIPRFTELTILEVLSEGWFKIAFPYVQAGYGYIQDLSETALQIDDPSFLPVEPEEEEVIVNEVDYVAYFLDGVVNVRKGPGKEYPNVGTAPSKTKLYIKKECNNWGYCENLNAWIKLSRIKKL